MPILLAAFLFLYLAIKAYKKKERHVFFVLAFYALGCLIGYVQTKHDLYLTSGNFGNNGRILYDATAYLILSTLILVFPIMKFRGLHNPSLNINQHSFLLMTDGFTFLSIIYILICLPHLKDSFNAIDFVAYKDNVMENGLNFTVGNPLLGFLFDLQGKIRPFMPFFLFYMLAYIKNNSKRKFLFSLMTVLPVIVTSIVSAHRHIVVYCLIQFLVAYLLFYDVISEKTKKRVNVALLIVTSLVICIVVLFAFLRFDNGNDYVVYSLLRYYGEPFVNFNTMLWNNSSYLMGNKSFPLIRSIMGMDVINQQNIRELTDYVKYLNYYFYSAVGTFYMDFGKWAFIVCLIIAFIFKSVLGIVKNNFTYLLLFYFYCIYTTQNYFYFQFQGNTNGLFLVYILFFIIIHKFLIKR